ncbi:MAG: hypothetical protein JWM74_1378 [Myxococcaceae bacterium]|nr:hypothetical protein [Myxococcaceae bacterium]
MRSVRALLLVGLSFGTAVGFMACGSRTGLPFDEAEEVATNPDGETIDVRVRDGRADQTNDVIDDLPTIDVRPKVDVDRTDCPDADATLVYLVTDTNVLLSFYPPTATFKRIGNIACPAPAGATPFSMAVDRHGVAYVLFSRRTAANSSAGLFRVSTATAACISTPYQVNQQGFDTFGMGYASDFIGAAETLFIASDEGNSVAGSGRLGSINTNNFVLTNRGTFNPPVLRAELTGTGAGELYAFYSEDGTGTSNDSFVGQINKQTAQVIAADRIKGIQQGLGWAFAFWGGDFYLFTCPPFGPTGSCSSSHVTRFRPSDKSVVQVGTYPGVIVGAGVSTCAPQ